MSVAPAGAIQINTDEERNEVKFNVTATNLEQQSHPEPCFFPPIRSAEPAPVIILKSTDDTEMTRIARNYGKIQSKTMD